MTRARLRAVPDPPRRFVIAVRVSRVMGRSGETVHSPELQVREAARASEAVGRVRADELRERRVFYDLDANGAVAPSSRPGMSAASSTSAPPGCRASRSTTARDGAATRQPAYESSRRLPRSAQGSSAPPQR